MPRPMSAAVISEKDKSYNKPVELYQVSLDTGTLYLAMYPENIEFFDEHGDPVIYDQAALTRTEIKTGVDTSIDQCQVSIDNVSRDMSAHIAATEFRGRRLVIWKVFLDQLDQPDNFVVIFDGNMDAPNITQHSVTVVVTSRLNTLDRVLPGRLYDPKCQWTFADPDTCGAYNGTPPTDAKCDKTLEGPEGCRYWEQEQGLSEGQQTRYYGGFIKIPEIRDIRKFG